MESERYVSKIMFALYPTQYKKLQERESERLREREKERERERERERALLVLKTH